MKVLISSLLLLLPLMLTSMVSSSSHTGVARGQRDQRQASGRWLREGGQECECQDWFLRGPRTPITAPRLTKKPCPCDRFKGRMKKTRHRRHHRKSDKHSRACQQFLTRCLLESFVLPL
ncbi:C-X-C motif chemokine 17 [Ovis canadensis]|uniref:C-X-C motif chemokine 17 n=1 Tax=Ovis canadensis TaxID=37174 RepID=UPI003751F2DD